MKFSTHTILVQDYPSAGQHLAYNTRTQALVKINQHLKTLIENNPQDSSSFSPEDVNNVQALYRMGLVVENEGEDRQKLKAFLEQLKYSIKKSIYAVTILTTYACNLKCVYCFEESSRVNEHMDFETAEHVMKWLKKKMIDFGYEELFITFYGGEPLLNKKTLEFISIEMQAWCKAQGIRFRFMLQTNGYLLTPELVDKYLPIGLDQVRISVDGLDEHDHNRPLRGGGPTLQRIIKNIVDCCDKVKIGISTSHQNGKVEHIEKLLNYFQELGILYKLGRFIFSPVHSTLGAKGETEQIRGSSCMCNYEDDTLFKANKRIEEILDAKNLKIKAGMAVTTCSVTMDHGGSTIDQKGYIYKCPSMLGHPELSTGNVWEKDKNEKHYEFLNLDIWKQCPQDCTYMPMCSGGCRLSSFLKHRNFKVAACHKPYLNKMAPEFIKKEYQELMAKQKMLVQT